MTTLQKSAVVYTNNKKVSSSNIVARLNSSLNSPQVYTFGNSVPNRWVAVGQGTNTIAYSNNGLTWIGLGTSTNFFTNFGADIYWNGSM